MLPFLKKFRKEIQKLENVSTEFSPPNIWYSTGNYALNRVLSGSYFKAIPQGRLTAFVGPSACLPGDEMIDVYIMKTCPLGKIEIIEEK